MFEKTEGKQDIIAKRNAAVAKAEAAIDAAQKANRDMTTAENEQYAAGMAEANQLNKKLEAHNSRFGLRSGSAIENSADAHFKFPGLGEFLRTKENGVMASLAEGSDLQYLLPPYEVQAFLAAYPQTDPFQAAGANITQLDGPWSDARIPIITAGTEPSSYSEGAGPSSDEPAGVFTARLTNPSKYAFLCKPTEEAMEDVESLASSLAQEGVRRVLNKATKAVTAALLSSLVTASATVTASGDDNLTDLLNMIAAIPSFFASPSNVWMLNRKTLALLRNTRVGADNLPAFNPTTNQILGYNAVLNDYVPNGKLVFGDFRSAVYQRRSIFHFQQLTEAYREAGKIGLRFYQRSQATFFSDAAHNSDVEQPLYVLTSDFGS